jgi:hypothetical protein
MLMLSTPYGPRGVFWRLWDEADDWDKVHVPVTAVSRISADAVEEARRTLPDWEFRSEYLCTFEDTPDALFTYELIETLVTDEYELLRLRG